MDRSDNNGSRPIDSLRRRQPVQAADQPVRPRTSDLTPEQRRAALAAKAAGRKPAQEDGPDDGTRGTPETDVREEHVSAKRSHKVVSTDDVAREVRRMDRRGKTRSAVTTLLVGLTAVAAVAIILAVYFLPVFKMNGDSMQPTFTTGDVVIGVRTKSFDRGDLLAFYYNNQVLVKRIIGVGGDVIDMAPDGTVSVNGEVLDEPYVFEMDYGKCDISFPFTVPVGKYFILGDHRKVSVDSRASAIGCVSESQLGGKLLFRVFPFDGFGPVS